MSSGDRHKVELLQSRIGVDLLSGERLDVKLGTLGQKHRVATWRMPRWRLWDSQERPQQFLTSPAVRHSLQGPHVGATPACGDL